MNEQQPDQSLNISSSDLNSLQIGGIAGRDLTVNQTQRVYLTNVFSSVQVDQTPTPNAQILSKKEYLWRRTLLNKVKNFWVNGILTKSLHTQVLLKLGLEERNEFIQNVLSKVSNKPEQSFPKGTAVAKIFDSLGAGRNLLILGEPGSGKTVTLLKLAKSLIARTEQDLSQQLPVILNLSSWAKKRQPIADWLIQELYEIYQVSKSLGKAWIEQQQLLLLLDGLDEVDKRYQNDCVLALNLFIQEFILTEMVVCSRIQDYECLSERLKLRSAIYVQPLTPQQIDRFLENAGDSLFGLKMALQNNTKLRNFASSPLILSIMSLTYQDCSAELIIQDSKSNEQRQQLFNAYVDRMFMRPSTTWPYSKEQTLYWLIWLAKRMTETSQTVFLIERLQPSWLPSQLQQAIYRIVGALILGLFGGGLGGWLGWLLGSPLDRVPDSEICDNIFFCSWDFSLDLIGPSCLIIGLIIGLISGFTTGILGTINMKKTLRWSWQEAKKFFRNGLIIGMSIGFIIVVSFGLFSVLNVVFFSGLSVVDWKNLFYIILGFIAFGLFVCIGLGLLIGTIVMFTGGLRGSGIQQINISNQGFWQSAKNALIFWVGFGLSVALLTGLIYDLGLDRDLNMGHELSVGFLSAIIGGFICGGSAYFRHFILKLILYLEGYTPWDYTRFLDYATNRLFMQKVGGGYVFIHRMLLEHFAKMELEQRKRIEE
ncbi:MAG: NACHT domain-containing protein [Symploca sp. SIO2G7]|nr:NACHT domain-containing protein [Symploca sp. SIO2G7]